MKAIDPVKAISSRLASSHAPRPTISRPTALDISQPRSANGLNAMKPQRHGHQCNQLDDDEPGQRGRAFPDCDYRAAVNDPSPGASGLTVRGLSRREHKLASRFDFPRVANRIDDRVTGLTLRRFAA